MANEIIYYPEMYSRGGIKLWKAKIKELVNMRELIWRLFLRDIKARYKQSVLGILWAIIMPFIVIGSFIYLNKAGVVVTGSTNVPYPLFALIGLAFWQIFATGLASCTNSIVGSGAVITKINLPKYSIVIASVGQAIFEFVIRFVLIGLGFLYYGIMPSWHILFMPILAIPILLLTLSLGFFLALLNAIVRDVANIVVVSLPFLMLMTPIMYVPKSGSIIDTLNNYNVIGFLVTSARDYIISNQGPPLLQFFIFLLIAIIFFLFALHIMTIVEPRICERV